jgi:hypothetical protein
MNGKQKWVTIACVSLVLTAFAVATLAASDIIIPQGATPLLIFRMEQASYEKNFLPTEKNEFVYTTEKGYNLTYQVHTTYSAVPLEPPTQGGVTCDNTCPSTCKNTCPATCLSTCPDTCVNTCYTCVDTCPVTCVDTCYTCVSTCSQSCVGTCYYTCGNSCGYTCGFTCNTC